jgi:putative tryptophan/tyrosine transport system substrate-binding protein
MRRREVFALLGWVAGCPLSAGAQPGGKIRRIGFMRVGPPPPSFIDGFRRGLRDLGLVEGRHFVIEYILTQSAAQMPDAAAELVRRGVDVILASGTPSVVPAKDATREIPIVFVATLDPVATGLVASLGRPTRNITGMTSASGDVIAKRLEMVRELLPNVDRIAILVRESSPTAAQYLQESQVAARKMSIELQVATWRDSQDVDRTCAIVRGASALLVADDAEFTARRAQIAEFALRDQLPTVSGLREMVEAGGLMAYGASFGELYRRAASHVHRILQGANAADLPVEQPTKFELVLNVRTAKLLGLTIPPTLLARADEVIE